MNLIYDRTAADLTEAKRIFAKVRNGESLTEAEQTAFNVGLRGSYNSVDMNRVESAVSELSAALNAAGYVNETFQQTWSKDVTATDWAQYLTNVQTLIDVYFTLPDTPEVPSESLDIDGANAIERILTDIALLINWMQHSYRKSGTFRSGVNAAHLPLQRSVT